MDKKRILIDFDVNIDPVSEAIVKKAEEELIKKLSYHAETMVFTHEHAYSNYRQPNDPASRNGLQDEMKDIIVQFMENNKEEIIKRTSENLAKRLAMSKAGKAILDKLEPK